MSIKLPWWLSLILLFLPLITVQSQTTRLPSKTGKTVMAIDTGWQFHEAGKTDWYSATVPGCVHTDLLANKLIEDPFYRDNEKKQQWIDKKDWEYSTTFRVSPQTLERENVELVFEFVEKFFDPKGMFPSILTNRNHLISVVEIQYRLLPCQCLEDS